MDLRRVRTAAAVGLAALACTRPPSTAPAPAAANHLPPVPVARGPLALRVVYPPANSVITARDSSFLLGSTGTGDAELTINGVPVHVWPNGAWLAWLPLPSDSLMQFHLVARTPAESTDLVYSLRRAARFVPPDSGVWADSTSLSPRGALWVAPGEYVALGVRAAEGSTVRLRLADGTSVPLEHDPRAVETPTAVRALDRDTVNLRGAVPATHYAGVLRGRRVGPDPGPVLPGASSAPALATRGTLCSGGTCRPAPPDTNVSEGTARAPAVEVIRGADSVRVPWPLQIVPMDTLPLVGELDPARPQSRGEGVVVGRAAPSGSYHWFFPSGTRAVVTGRRGDEIRLRLSDGVDAWVAAADLRALPSGTPAPRATVGSITVSSVGPDRASIRVPLGARIPFRVDEGDRHLGVTLYSASGDASWIRYPSADSVVRQVAWRQDTADRVVLEIELTDPVWGYRARWSGTDLILEIRRPPRSDRGRPLRGRLIVLDPGHPPLGATGPTGLYEADANLTVALRLRMLLMAEGANVVMTRTTTAPVELGARVRLADSLDADLLVSIHNNALPDGLNPFTNNGTSVFYNQPRSLPLARAIQAALVRRLGLRDLGVSRGDLALARPTWMPAVLCEGLFMTLPDQEAALRSPEGQELYARGVYEGIVEFLKNVNSER